MRHALRLALVVLVVGACTGRARSSAEFVPWTSPGSRASFDRTGELGGNETLHVLNAGPRTALWLRRLPASAGLTYRISASLRTARATAAFVSGRFVVGGKPIDATSRQATVRGTTDWHQIMTELAAPHGATALEVRLETSGPGEAWFSAIEVTDDAAALLGEGDALLTRVEHADPVAFPSLAARWRTLAGEPGESAEARRARATDAEALRAAVRLLARSAGLGELGQRFENVFGVHAPAYIVGWASPMARVFPTDLPVAAEAARAGRIEAFRGEVEALQLVLVPRTQGVTAVRVTPGDLVGPGVIPASSIEIHPVGAVEMAANDRSEALAGEEGYRGWWPDPLLENRPFDVAPGTTQAVWIAVHVPRDAPPGSYHGSITVAPRDAPPLGLELEAQVWDFALPERWHFRNVLSWHDRWAADLYGKAWNRELEQRFIDFLVAHRINVTSMYEGDEPYATPERLVELARRGQNTLIVASLAPTARLAASQPYLEHRLASVLPVLREAGMADRALVYGWDERDPQWYGEIRAAAELLAERYDHLPLLMAGVDESCGLDTPLGGLPNLVFCPLMRRYDPARARSARQRGNAVWWYETHWPIEQPLIRSRLIPWQTFTTGADGFLVWCINRWVGNQRPIGDDLHTRWHASLDGVEANGSAAYLYPGIDGPRSSLRLENFRDGIEDYDILIAARERLERLEAAHDEGPQTAALRQALTLPDTFASDAAAYRVDADAVRARRRLLARALAGAA